MHGKLLQECSHVKKGQSCAVQSIKLLQEALLITENDSNKNFHALCGFSTGGQPLCTSLATASTGLHPLTVGCSSLNVCQWVLLVTVW